jgi:hypothetical protein
MTYTPRHRTPRSTIQRHSWRVPALTMSPHIAQGHSGVVTNGGYHERADFWAKEGPQKPGPQCITLPGSVWSPDASSLSAEVIGEAAAQLLEAGLMYLCAWGPDCERVHDIFDEMEVIREIDSGVESKRFLLTTWHNEPLEEASLFLCSQRMAKLKSCKHVFRLNLRPYWKC